MIAKRIAILTCLAAFLLPLVACNKSGQTASAASKTPSSQLAKGIKPIDFAGVDLRTVNRKLLEETYYRALKVPLVPRNDFESVADASNIYPGAEKVDVAMTRNGSLATMQFIFPGKGDPNLAAKVTQLMESKYGKPTTILGKTEEGEYRAIWDMGGDFFIQVGRSWPDTTTHLNFISNNNLAQLRIEIQQRLDSPKNIGSASK